MRLNFKFNGKKDTQLFFYITLPQCRPISQSKFLIYNSIYNFLNALFLLQKCVLESEQNKTTTTEKEQEK